MKLSVLYDHQIFSSQKYGGISRYFCELASNISNKENVDIEILSPLYINSYLDTFQNLQITGVKIPDFCPWEGQIASRFNRLISPILLNKKKDVDILHETYYGKEHLRKSNCKKIITVYDMIHEIFPKYFPDASFRETKKRAIEEADHIICISHNTKQDLMNILNIQEEKISVVYLGHTLINEPISSTFHKEKPYVLYVGSRYTYKNFDGLIKSYSRSDKIKNSFNIICFGGGDFTEEEKLMFRKYKLSSEQVKYVGGSDSDLVQYYQNAAVFVYPSLYEGFGIPPLEAMSFNCPVICSNTSSMPEVVGDAAELFDPNEEGELDNSLNKILYSNSLNKELIAAGKNRINQFSWQKCADETFDVYKKTIGS